MASLTGRCSADYCVRLSPAHFAMTTSSLVTINAECCFPNISPQTTMFCSEKEPAPFVIITVITARISLCPPCHTEDCASGVLADFEGGELPERPTAEDVKTKGFLRLTLTPELERERVAILCAPILSRAEQSRLSKVLMASYICIQLRVQNPSHTQYCTDSTHHVSKPGIITPTLQMGHLRFGRGWDLPEVIEFFQRTSYRGPSKAGLLDLLHLYNPNK